MTITTDKSAIRVLDVTADVPIDADFPAFEASDVHVYYGIDGHEAVAGADYTVQLSEAFSTFTVTPTAALIAKLDALIAADPNEVNALTIRREMQFETSASPMNTGNTKYTAQEFERAAMRDIQLRDGFERALKFGPAVAPPYPSLQFVGKFDTALEDTMLVITQGGGIKQGAPYTELIDGVAKASEHRAFAYQYMIGAKDFRDQTSATVAAATAAISASLGRVAVTTVKDYTQFAFETQLTYDPTTTGVQVLPGMTVNTNVGSYVVLDRDATDYHYVTVQGVKLREAGPFTSVARLLQAVRAGDKFPPGITLAAGPFRFVADPTVLNGSVTGFRKLDVGKTEMFGGTTLPPEYLPCDGTLRNIADYPDLAAYLGSTWGPKTATQFVLPIMTDKNRFPRAAGGAVPVGSRRADEMRAHAHKVNPPPTNTDNDTHNHAMSWAEKGVDGGGGTTVFGPGSGNSRATDNDTHNHTVDIAPFDSDPTGGTETRPYEAAMLFGIRY